MSNNNNNDQGWQARLGLERDTAKSYEAEAEGLRRILNRWGDAMERLDQELAESRARSRKVELALGGVIGSLRFRDSEDLDESVSHAEEVLLNGSTLVRL